VVPILFFEINNFLNLLISLVFLCPIMDTIAYYLQLILSLVVLKWKEKSLYTLTYGYLHECLSSTMILLESCKP